MDAVATPKAGRRDWIGLAVIALPCLLYSMDLTVLNLAVPHITADLQPSSSQLLWIVDIYGFVLAGFLITMGTLGDRIGRRRLLLAGAAAFGVASVLAAFSTSAEMLIGTRAILGVAGATLAPSTLSLIRNMFLDQRQRTVAIGVWGASFSAGAAVGPLVGGILLQHFWWGSAFLVAVPVMVLLLVLGPVLLPEFRGPNAGHLDLLSAAMSLIAVLAVIYGLTQTAEIGFGWPPGLSVAAGLAVGVAFVRRQRTLADPLIDLRLFRVPAFDVAIAANILAIFTAVGAFLFISQYLQLVLGFSPLQAGLWTLPWAGALIAGSMLAPVIVRRVRAASALVVGLSIEAAGFVIFTQVDGDASRAVFVAMSVVIGFGVAVAVILSTDLIVGTAPPERAGAASSISETSTELGGALGIAILGSIGAAVYRADLNGAMPQGVPEEAAVAARDTLGGAVAVSGHLPGPMGGDLLDAAQHAFTNGLQLVAMVSAIVLAGLAIAAVLLLRDRGLAETETRSDQAFDAV